VDDDDCERNALAVVREESGVCEADRRDRGGRTAGGQRRSDEARDANVARRTLGKLDQVGANLVLKMTEVMKTEERNRERETSEAVVVFVGVARNGVILSNDSETEKEILRWKETNQKQNKQTNR